MTSSNRNVILLLVILIKLVVFVHSQRRTTSFRSQDRNLHYLQTDIPTNPTIVRNSPSIHSWASADPDATNSNSTIPPTDSGIIQDGTLAYTMICFLMWLGFSALIIASFIRREKRRELLLTFWRKIDSDPMIKSQLEAATGLPFPRPPKSWGLQRFIRAVGVALIVTIGLNIALLMMAPAVSPSNEESNKNSSSSNSLDPNGLILDPDDAAYSPMFGLVCLGLMLGLTMLLLRNSCGSPTNSQVHEERNTGSRNQALDAAATTRTPYVLMSDVRYVAVPSSAPPADGILDGTAADHQGPPPTYSSLHRHQH